MQFRLAVMCLLILSVVVGGCQPEMKNVDLTQCPDGTVDVLLLTEGAIQHESSSFLQQVFRNDDQIVVVDFWATWCGPCLALAPELEKVKTEWGDKITLIKVDVDQNGELSSFFEISSIPSVQIFRGGKAITGFRGFQSASQISSLIRSVQ